MNMQSILAPAGPQAAAIEGLWWVFLLVTSVVFVAVVAAVIAALLHRDRDGGVPEPTLSRAVAIAVGLTVVTLIGLITLDAFSARRLSSLESDGDRVVIDITGRQWWWDIEYQHPDPSMRVRTANELRLPVGRVVQINLRSADVIHSFWVPALHGKRDAIPGHLNELWLKADAAGTYRGQCAEFCGLQHAHMALTVIVEPPEAFSKWIDAQRTLTPTAPTELATRGRLIVEQGPCGTCHTVRETNAGGRVGPDLTHVAARTTIAAGTLPMSRENLKRWINDPQQLKPGTRMPSLGLSGDELDAVVAYLGGTP